MLRFWVLIGTKLSGVLLFRICFEKGAWFPIWGLDVKVAKIHGSSRRKKEPKASFSMGFRSHVRHFRGAILELLRPSEAWCFTPGR